MTGTRGTGRDGRYRSLWLREALGDGFAPHPPLEGVASADVCIVGGGYTGLWAALRLKELEPSLDVVLLEADICGGGASGRNGGFVLTWWAKFRTLVSLYGTGEALRLARESERAVERIGEFCQRHGVDAGFRRAGWLWAATNLTQVGAWRATVDDLERLGEHPFAELGPEEAASCAGSSVHLGGVLERGGAIVQPARLALGLRRVALGRGVRVHEGSPMTALARRRGGVAVRTPSGVVNARRVVLAMNAWANRFAEVRRRVLVIGSDVLATVPSPERVPACAWRDGVCVSDSRLLVHYYRTTEDGRIVFGKGGGVLAFGALVGSRFEGPSPRRRLLEESFRAAYPSMAGVAVDASWTGPIDRTRSGLPFFTPLRVLPAAVVGVGYSGNGVGPSYVGGLILASMALERDDEWSGSGIASRPSARFPPEPFRFAGATVVRRAVERKERAEDAGRPPGRVAEALTRLAPPGLVPPRG